VPVAYVGSAALPVGRARDDGSYTGHRNHSHRHTYIHPGVGDGTGGPVAATGDDGDVDLSVCCALVRVVFALLDYKAMSSADQAARHRAIRQAHGVVHQASGGLARLRHLEGRCLR